MMTALKAGVALSSVGRPLGGTVVVGECGGDADGCGHDRSYLRLGNTIRWNCSAELAPIEGRMLPTENISAGSGALPAE